MSAHSDYREATLATNNKAWEREMILEKAAYNLEQMGFSIDAMDLRVLRGGRQKLLEHLVEDMGIPDDEAEHDEGEEGEAFADE